MTNRNPRVEDLSGLGRRGALNEEQTKLLERELAGSLVERVVHDAGRAFDAMTVIQPGDAELLSRVTERLVAKYARNDGPAPLSRRWLPARGRFSSRRSLNTLALAALVLSLATAAAATALGYRPFSSAVVVPAESRQSLLQILPRLQQLAHSARSIAPAPENVEVAEPRVSAEPTAANSARGRVAPEATTASAEPVAPLLSATEPTAPPQVTAAALFSQANALRSGGNIDAAIAAYHELQRQFAASPEAALSRVSLGNLLLKRGAAAQALDQFSSYLRLHPRGVLTEEALRGKAEAQGRLGQSAEARATWQELLARFPQSVYADLARSHL